MNILKKYLKFLRSRVLKLSIGNKNNEESGVALIMTLGMLAMLVVLALAFTSNSITSSKIANSNANRTRAQMIAKGALDRAFAIQRLDAVDFKRVSEKCGDFNYGTNDPRQGSDNYNDNLGNLKYNGNALTEDPDDYDDLGEYEYDIRDGIKWINVTVNMPEHITPDNPDGTTIIGRYAYVCPVDLDTVPGITPDAAVTHTGDKSGSGSTAVVIDAHDEDEATSASKRYGVNVHEINLQNIDPDAASGELQHAHINALSSNAVTGGTLVNGSTWFSMGGSNKANAFNTMFANLGIGDATLQDNIQKKYFVVDGLDDPEASWVDDDGDGERDAPELNIRFNLARTDWENTWASDGQEYNDPAIAGDEADGEGDIDNSGSVEVNDHRLAFMNDYILVNSNLWLSGHSDPDGRGIDWLTSYSNGTDDPDNFPDLATKKKQIAANLIDYVDSDSIPTSDVDPTKWISTQLPTFTGNDLHPMISELWAICEAKLVTDDWDNDGAVDWHYTIKLYWGAEICNPYNEELPGDAIIQIRSAAGVNNINPRPLVPYGKAGDLDETMGLAQDDITSADSTLIIQGPFPAGSYTYDENIYATLSKSYEAPSGNAVQKAGCQFRWGFNTARLLYNGLTSGSIDTSEESPDSVDIVIRKEDWSDAVKDYAWIKDSKGNEGYLKGNPDTRYKNQSWHKTGRFHISVDDPRHNLHHDDWSDYTYGENWQGYLANGGYGSLTTETPDQMNDIETSSENGDKEQQSHSKTNNKGIVSTGYIRNAPMLSPWEIGAIHRAAPWETINIKKFDPDTITVMDDYADGDLNILDQTKMTSDTEIYGKFNLNTAISKKDINNGEVNKCIRALVMDVLVGTGYEDPVSGGTAIGKGDADIIAASFTANHGGDWLRRGRISAVQALTDGNSLSIAQDSDAEKEEIIGKIINLCKADPVNSAANLVGPTANMLIIAQAVNDVGGGITVYKDLNFDGVIAPANEKDVDIDLNGDGSSQSSNVSEEIQTKYGRFDLNADQILSEIKMYVTIEEEAPLGSGIWNLVTSKFIE